jgi:hypothetical protein
MRTILLGGLAALYLAGTVACAPVDTATNGSRPAAAANWPSGAAENLIRSRFEDETWQGVGGSRESRLAWMTPALAEASLRLDALTDNIGVGMEPSMGSVYIYATEARYQTRRTPYGAEVTVRFLNTNAPRQTRFEMVMTQRGWRVADIIGTDVETGRSWRYTNLMAETFAAVARGEGPRDPS